MRRALEGCDGVKQVEVEFTDKVATAIVEEDADPEKLLEAVRDAGYDKTTLR